MSHHSFAASNNPPYRFGYFMFVFVIRCFTYIISMHHTNNEQSLIIIHGILESQCLPFTFSSFQSTMLSVWHYSCIILRSSFFRIEYFFFLYFWPHNPGTGISICIFFLRIFPVVYVCHLFCFSFFFRQKVYGRCFVNGVQLLFNSLIWWSEEYGFIVFRVLYILGKLYSKYVCQGT